MKPSETRADACRKPKPIEMLAECVTEEYDDHGGGAFGVQLESEFLYDSKSVRRLIKWLERAEIWLKRKEEYR